MAELGAANVRDFSDLLDNAFQSVQEDFECLPEADEQPPANDDFLDFEWEDKRTERPALTTQSAGRIVIIQLKNYSAILKEQYRVPVRPETEVDASALKKRFTNAGCSVRVIKDPECADVLDLLEEEARNLKEAKQPVKYFMLILLSQSFLPATTNQEVVFLYDGYLTFSDIVHPFYTKDSHAPEVVKLFMFHVPKCGKADLGLTILRKKKSPPVEEQVPRNSFLAKEEILLVHSTIAGCLAFRNALSGSYFIQRFCQALDFNLCHKEMNILTLLTRVNGQISTYLSHPVPHEGLVDAGGVSAALLEFKRKPTITIYSTLSKDVHLFE